MECLSCGCTEFKRLKKPFKVELNGEDVWLKSFCWCCEICSTALMDSEQMNDFLKLYREHVAFVKEQTKEG